MRAYRISGKYQSNGIDYRYRHTHTGTLIVSLIIFVDRIDLFLLVAVTCDTPILCYSHATDAPKISRDVKYVVHLQKIEDLLNGSFSYPRFRIHYTSRVNSNYIFSVCSILKHHFRIYLLITLLH